MSDLIAKYFLSIYLVHYLLEGTTRYKGLLLAPAKGFGLRPRLFLPFGQKKSLFLLFFLFKASFGAQ